MASAASSDIESQVPEPPRRSTESSAVAEGRDIAASQTRDVPTRRRSTLAGFVRRAFGISKPETQTPPVVQPNPSPQPATPLLRQRCAFAYRRRCGYLVVFLLYMGAGVGFFCLAQSRSVGSKKGAYFQGSNGTSVTDATYFTAVSLTSIGYGDIYPARKAAVIVISLYIYLGGVLFAVASVILSGLMHLLEDRFISFCVRCWRRSVRGLEGPAPRNEGPRRKTRIFIHFVLSLLFTCLLAVKGGFYVAVSAVTTVGFGNKSFTKGGDRVYALCFLFPAVLFYGRLASLIGEFFGNPLPS